MNNVHIKIRKRSLVVDSITSNGSEWEETSWVE